MTRVLILAVVAAFGLAGAAQAHHGWTTYSDQESQVSGVVEAADFGGPHGQVRVRSGQAVWNVMLAPPVAIQRADLTAQALPRGAKVTAHGHKRTDGTLEIKTERLVVGDRTYDLYPSRP